MEEGPGRWRRYFYARARIDANIDQGRPGFDYRVCKKMVLKLLRHSLSKSIAIVDGMQTVWGFDHIQRSSSVTELKCKLNC